MFGAAVSGSKPLEKRLKREEDKCLKNGNKAEEGESVDKKTSKAR